MERPPFRHAVEALRFLLNPERATVDRPPVARLADKRRGEPGPLSGLDGAATAASAETMLKGNLTPLQMAVLACRYAPSQLRCDCKSDCCGGWRTNQVWMDAILYVAGDAVYRVMPQREPIPIRFVKAVLLKEYGKKKIAITDIGSDLGLSSGSCSNYRRRVTDWLLHHPVEGDDRSDQPSRPMGHEVVAFAKAEESLRSGGFIEWG